MSSAHPIPSNRKVRERLRRREEEEEEEEEAAEEEEKEEKEDAEGVSMGLR